MKFDDWLRQVLEILPNAEVGEDNEGQLVIYTDLKVATSLTHPTIPAGEVHVIPLYPEA